MKGLLFALRDLFGDLDRGELLLDLVNPLAFLGFEVDRLLDPDFSERISLRPPLVRLRCWFDDLGLLDRLDLERELERLLLLDLLLVFEYGRPRFRLLFVLTGELRLERDLLRRAPRGGGFLGDL